MPRCEICGRPAEATLLGRLLCPDCRSKYREFRCIRCGQTVVHLTDTGTDGPELTSRICSLCQIEERVAALRAEDREAIRSAAIRGTLPAVKEMRERLGWSIRDAVAAVEVLRSHAR